jgi:type VI secretion system protein ImpJ
VSRAPKERRKRRRADQVSPAIHWHEGMLLAPQHFQLASRRAEELLHYHASIVSPFHWGLIDCVREPLKDDVITVTRLEAVMPDGLVVTHSTASGGELSIDVKPHRDAIATEPQTIFLTVAARNAGERFHKRYELDEEQVKNEESAEDELTVKLLRPRLELTCTDFLPESSVGFPIARVEMRGSGVVEQQYEPPWLRVRSGSAIHTLCSEVAGHLRATAAALQASIRHSSESLHAAQLLETRLLIHSLTSVLPTLEALLDSNVAHPFPLYLALVSVAGNLAAGSVPPRLPAYDHEHLLSIFNKVKQTIEMIMSGAIHAPYELHPFVFKDGGFRLHIDPAWPRHKLLLGVSTPSGVRAQDVDTWICESTIGEAGALPHLLSGRSIGIKRSRVDGAAMPVASGYAFYELLQLPADFRISPRELVIRNVNPGQPEEIVLYVNTET